MIPAQLILDELLTVGVTDVLGIPDNAAKALLDLIAVEPRIRLLTVTREGEAFAIASGLWIGGRTPAVLIQNTGLLESGDALRGTAMRMRVPLLCLVTCRGFARMEASGVAPPHDAERLSRPDLDSVALLTQPTLQAWGIPWELVETAADVPRVGAAFRRAREREQPVAVLVTRDTTS